MHLVRKNALNFVSMVNRILYKSFRYITNSLFIIFLNKKITKSLWKYKHNT